MNEHKHTCQVEPHVLGSRGAESPEAQGLPATQGNQGSTLLPLPWQPACRKLCVVLFRPGASHLLCPTKLFKSPPQGLLSRQIPELSSWFQKIKYGPGYCLHAAGGVAACRKYRLPFSAFLPVSRVPTEPSRAEQRVGEVTSRR